MPLSGSTYDEVYGNFRWDIPEFYNIGVDVCDRWAALDPEKLALICVDDEKVEIVSFGQLRDMSNACASMLANAGVGSGDRVGILLSQRTETAYAHIAVYKMGAIAVPLFSLFGPEALLHRLHDSGAKAVITDAEGAGKLASIKDELPCLSHIFSTEPDVSGTVDFHREMTASGTRFTPMNTRSDDPAVIIYTSGTTGAPKGALHAHRVLLGHLPGVEFSHELFPQPGDLFWTPADWAWIGGLLDVLLPSLHHGVPVVARRFAKFTGEAAFDLLERHQVRNAFIPPTALKAMRGVLNPKERFNFKLRTIGSGGESLGAELLDWGRNVFGLTINEFYGQTEMNLVLSSSSLVMRSKPGYIGKSVPGHRVKIVNEQGSICVSGELGDIAIATPDPVQFLGYWQNDSATASKFRGEWLITGDQGMEDGDGYIKFVGRDDDIITSSGYRIGPGEIENCLLQHPAVQMVAVIGLPDPKRTEIVTAFIVLNGGWAATPSLVENLQNTVKRRLGAHEYPRNIIFVDEIPLTTTGKIVRKALKAQFSNR